MSNYGKFAMAAAMAMTRLMDPGFSPYISPRPMLQPSRGEKKKCKTCVFLKSGCKTHYYPRPQDCACSSYVRKKKK